MTLRCNCCGNSKKNARPACLSAHAAHAAELDPQHTEKRYRRQREVRVSLLLPCPALPGLRWHMPCAGAPGGGTGTIPQRSCGWRLSDFLPEWNIVRITFIKYVNNWLPGDREKWSWLHLCATHGTPWHTSPLVKAWSYPPLRRTKDNRGVTPQ